MKTLKKVRGQQLAQFQRTMNSAKKMMKIENKYHIEFRNEIDSMKMATVRATSMPMKQTVCLPESKKSRVRMKKDTKTCDAASSSTANKMKVPISKVRVSGANPKCQGRDSQDRYSENQTQA
jgi:hypothetical protein